MAKPRFRQASPGPEVAKRPRLNPSTDWVSLYAPTTSQDVAIHKLKLAEIEKALQHDSVVVISGPAGSSKSSAVRVLANELRRPLLEWSTPDFGVGETRIVDGFRDFLTGCTMHHRNEIVFVDDLPNLFHEDTRSQFEDTLLSWQARAQKDSSLPTLVIVFTEVETTARYQDAAVASRIFGSALDNAKWIKTNPVNAGLLTKVLKKVAADQKIAYVDAAEQIRLLARGGDIRNALNSFEFWARSPDIGLVGGRSEAVGLFHAIGKVVYGSDEPDSVAPAIDAFDDSKDTFALTVLENYSKARKSQLPIHVALDAVDMLSLGDLGLPDANYNVATILAHEDPHLVDTRVPSRFIPLGFTQFPKWRKEQNERHAFLQRWVRAFRIQGPASSQLATEIKSLESQGIRPKIEQAFWDSESDYSSDSDF